MKQTIACIKVGEKYDARYVNRLEAAVRRHTTLDHRFVCLTDDPKDLRCEAAPIETTLPGWWSKLVLFKPHSVLEGQRVVFLDLDTVITDNIDFLFEYDGPLAMIRDWWQPVFNSSVMSIAPGFGQHIWHMFSPENMRLYGGDQDWITMKVPGADTWQTIAPGKIGSYKADGLAASPGKFAIVCFHGYPKPHDVMGWVHEAWY